MLKVDSLSATPLSLPTGRSIGYLAGKVLCVVKIKIKTQPTQGRALLGGREGRVP